MTKEYWILLRDGKVQNVFEDRKKAVEHLKEILIQTLKDFEKQDKSNEYDYKIIIPETIFMPVSGREAYLGF